MSLQFRPLYDRVLVKRVEAEAKSSGGLFLPETAKEKPHTAEVVAVGNGRVLKNGDIVAMTVKPGDKVILGTYSGDEVKLDGVEHIIIREDEILAVLN
jgi:chaperonin GroES